MPARLPSQKMVRQNSRGSEKVIRNEKLFWMIWKEGGYPPTLLHKTLLTVQKEAQRLAEKQPKDRFFVLEAKAHVVFDETTKSHMWTYVSENGIGNHAANPVVKKSAQQVAV